MKAKMTILLIGLIILSGCAQQPSLPKSTLSTAKATDVAQTSTNLNQNAQNSSMAKNPVAVFETNLGIFKAEIFQDKVPLTANNFIKLSKDGFYNNLTFHRVIADFMIQGGDPNGDGTGGPGYEIKDEFNSQLKHSSKGMLSMANAGPNTGGSQFFITLAPTPWLDGKHAIFGKITEGIDVVEKIGNLKTDGNDRPVPSVVIKKLTIV